MYTKNESAIIAAAKESNSMAEAAAKLKLHFSTFKRHAVRLGVYVPNQGGRGTNKPKSGGKIPLEEILDGLHPQIQSFKLKQKLFEAGLKNNKCEECGIAEWQGKPLMCELDHIDGDRTNHLLSNLRIICPNCHSQTSTFRFKKRHPHVVK